MKNYHITKARDGEGWNLKAEGGKRATLTAETKAEIIKETREFAQGKEISVKIHTGDGKIQEERTYPRSSDPKKTPG
jgi:hypothetical protein